MTEGSRDPGFPELHFDETYLFEDGERDAMRWAVGRDAQGRSRPPS